VRRQPVAGDEVVTNEKHPREEGYALGYSELMVRALKSRTAEVNAEFLLPHLRPGMRLLDCGCGPGSITLGLARAVAPGDTVGIDIERSQVDMATEAAEREGVNNVRFQVANIYELPFPADSFDVAFMYALLGHLDRPIDGLREVLRVLKPGGIAGLSHGDFGVDVLAPPSRFLETIKARTIEHGLQQGRNRRGRNQQRLMRRAGFAELQSTLNADDGQGMRMANTAPDDLRHHLDAFVHFGMLTPTEANDPTLIAAYIDEMEQWVKDPDRAYVWAMHWETIGRKPEKAG